MSKNNAADNSKGLIMSEKEKMLAGKIYDPSDKELLRSEERRGRERVSA